MSYNGIDVSFYQGDIDWPQVQADGIQFAMIRASYGTEGVDPQFSNNMNNIAETSIARGAYHFCYALSVEEAAAEANNFLNTIAPYKFNYPVALDLEYEPILSVGRETLTNIALTFCDTVEKAGYYTMIYANLNWLSNYLDMSILDRFDIWLAQWGSKPTFSGSFGMWQHSSTGRVSGINGDVDLDISYRDYPAIIAKNGLNKWDGSIPAPSPTPEPNPSPEPTPGESFDYTVKPGDNLWDIAQRFLGAGTRYNEIVSLNNLDSTTIYPGQILKIPGSESTVNNYRTYTVEPGDNLWDISQRFLGSGTRYNEIVSLNNLDSTTIYPGQVLKIPN